MKEKKDKERIEERNRERKKKGMNEGFLPSLSGKEQRREGGRWKGERRKVK
jgi:hypothetical protein